MKKSKTTSSKKGRAKAVTPQIFVRTVDGPEPHYARASIRVKAGQYCYLMWRDGERVLNFYLGKRRES